MDYYEQGYTAYGNGVWYGDCPFTPETNEAFEWQLGWVHAEQEDPQNFE